MEDARAWIEVSLDAVRANYDTVRRKVGTRTAVIPMVKANGYGLGLDVIVRALEPLGPWGFGVATAEEGAAVRALGVTRPVLAVAPMTAGEMKAAAESRLTVTISSLDALDAWIGEAERVGGSPLEFHVEVDTGMGRAGFPWEDVGAWGPALKGRLTSAVRWTGCYTHFHSADSPDEDPTRLQWERFRQSLVQLPVRREDLLIHACNSASALRWPDFAADAVRPGIFLYGGHPAPQVAAVEEPMAVASVRARLALVQDREAGSTAGYGATYAATERERWGTVAIGYGDGLRRAVGNRGSVLIRGVRVPVIGRVSMDMITVALGRVPEARAGDVVTVIGQDGVERITVDDVARTVDTIGYEVLTGLGVRLPRVMREEREGGRSR